MELIAIRLTPMVLAALVVGAIGYRLRWPRLVTGVATFCAAALVLTGTVWFAQRPSPDVAVTLTSPSDGQEVSSRDLASGTVSDPDADVYVVVHPVATDLLFVQNRPVVGQDGRWQVEVYFGAGDVGRGERFEVLALATTEGAISRALRGNRLSPGDRLKEVPPHLSKSTVSIVTRST